MKAENGKGQWLVSYMFSIIWGIKLTLMPGNTSTYLPECAFLLHCIASQSALLAEHQTAVPLWNIHQLSRAPGQLH